MVVKAHPEKYVRFKIAEDTYECLATSLSREEFPLEVIKELYHKRWNIEESFKILKYAIGADSFCLP